MAILNFACVTHYMWRTIDVKNMLQISYKKWVPDLKFCAIDHARPAQNFLMTVLNTSTPDEKHIKKSWGTLSLDFLLFAILWNPEKTAKSGKDTNLICAKRNRNKLYHLCIP